MKFLVVLPTYNEKENIAKIIPSILEQNTNIDILVVDDNSPDGTGKIVNRLSQQNKRIHLLARKNKEGLGAAYMAGFEWGLKHHYDFLISMDADFSHQPKYLKNMLSTRPQIDLLVGSRYISGGKIKGWGLKRLINSRGANLFTRFILGLKTHDATAGFKRYSRRFLQSLNFKKFISSGYAFQVEMVMYAEKNHYLIQEFPITFIDRQAGKSKIEGELKKSAKIVLRLAWQRPGLRQFVKFLIVGAVSTLVDWGVYWLVANFIMPSFLPAGQALKQSSKASSFVVSAAFNYYFNRRWTFASHDQHITLQTIKFYLVATSGLIFNNLIFYLITKIFLWRDIWGLCFATGIVFFWNFFINRAWTFKK